jgi:hypothetical protein
LRAKGDPVGTYRCCIELILADCRGCHIEDKWSKSLATELLRTQFLTTDIPELLERPEVTARTAETEKAFQLTREQVR